MKKMLSVLGLAVAVLVVALALTVGGGDEALAGKNDVCPKKTLELVKVCIDKKARSSANFASASADCADEAGRLPTAAELDAFRHRPGIELGRGLVFEWTGDVSGEDRTLGILEDGETVLYFNVLHTSSQPYRCVK